MVEGIFLSMPAFERNLGFWVGGAGSQVLGLGVRERGVGVGYRVRVTGDGLADGYMYCHPPAGQDSSNL